VCAYLWHFNTIKISDFFVVAWPRTCVLHVERVSCEYGLCHLYQSTNLYVTDKSNSLPEALNMNTCTNSNHMNPEMREQYCLKSGCSCQCNCHEALILGSANSFPSFCCQSEDAKSFVEHWVKVRVILRLEVYRQSVLAPRSLRLTTRDFFLQLNPFGHSPYVTSSLTRRWVCLLWIGFPFVKCTYRTYSIGLTWLWGMSSSREAASPIKVIIWNYEPLMGFETCLWEHSHI
jgi:hypothetical protein